CRPDRSDRQERSRSRLRSTSPSPSFLNGYPTNRKPSGTSCVEESSAKVSTSPASPVGRSSSGRRWRRCSAKERMAAKVRIDRRTNRLFLDLHIGGRRKRVFSELPATPKNIEIMQAKAEAIDREAFLGTLDLGRHFPEKAPKRPTVADLWEEWRKKKANDVTPLTMHWYEKAARVRLLPFWGKRRLDAIEPRHFDEFKARLVADELAPRTMNIELGLLKQLLRFAADRGYASNGLTRWITFQRSRRSEIQPFTFEEKAAFLKALPLRWRPYFEVAFGTGLRPSEQ